MTRKKLRHFDCAVEATLSVVGGKWKAVILFHLMGREFLRFGQLRRMLPKVTQQMLTSQLRELEGEGVIRRKVYAQVPPRVEYSMTEYGESLTPILKAMRAWGEQHHSEFKKA